MKTLQSKLLKGRITRWGFRTTKLVALGLIAVGVLAGPLLTHAGDMVPYQSKTIGQMVLDPNTGAILSIEETGIGTHLGKFTLTGAYDGGYFMMTAIATNGDKLFLVVVDLIGNTVEMDILGGTGRFNGTTGHITGTTTLDPNPVSFDPLILAYTATVTGEISTVGSSKKK
jgi:hypothetical protein